MTFQLQSSLVWDVPAIVKDPGHIVAAFAYLQLKPRKGQCVNMARNQKTEMWCGLNSGRKKWFHSRSVLLHYGMQFRSNSGGCACFDCNEYVASTSFNVRIVVLSDQQKRCSSQYFATTITRATIGHLQVVPIIKGSWEAASEFRTKKFVRLCEVGT